MSARARRVIRGRSLRRVATLIVAVSVLAAVGLAFGPASPAFASEVYSVRVWADDREGERVCDLGPGDSITWTASGYWYMGGTEGGGPDGIRWANPDESGMVFSNAKIGTLLGNILQEEIYFAMGDSGWAMLEEDEAGELRLVFNDRWDYYWDNSGYLDVTVSVNRACGQARSIEVVSPSGGETWQVGSKQKATWRTAGSIPYVDICVSRDGGSSWTMIVENCQNVSDVYNSVTVTVGTPASDHCLVGIGDSTTWNGHGYDVWDQSDSTFRIAAAVQTYAVTASVSGSHGSVTPTSKSVEAGKSVDVTMTPDSGYKVGKVTDNGNDATSKVVPLYGGPEGYSVYTLTNVQGNHSVVVTFVPLVTSYTVTASVSGGQGGSVSPTSKSVAAGGSLDITISAASGYKVSKVTDNGTDVTSKVAPPYGGGLGVSVYGLTNVQSAHSVVASFAPLGYRPDPDGWRFTNWGIADLSGSRGVWRHLYGDDAFHLDTTGEWIGKVIPGYPQFKDSYNLYLYNLMLNGVCLGMAASSASAYVGDSITPQRFGATTLWDLGTYGVTNKATMSTNLSDSVRWYLEEFHFLQESQEFSTASVTAKNSGGTDYSSQLRSFVSSLQQAVAKEPVVVWFKGIVREDAGGGYAGKAAGHAIVVYDVDLSSDGNLATAHAYDPDFPGTPQDLTVSVTANSPGWNYRLFQKGKDIAVGYVTVDSLDDMVGAVAGTLHQNKNKFAISSSAEVVFSSAGVKPDPLISSFSGEPLVDVYAVDGTADRSMKLIQSGSEAVYLTGQGSQGAYMVMASGAAGSQTQITVTRGGNNTEFTSSADDIWVVAQNTSTAALAQFAGASISGQVSGVKLEDSGRAVVKCGGAALEALRLKTSSAELAIQQIPEAALIAVDPQTYDPTTGKVTVLIDGEGDGTFERTQLSSAKPGAVGFSDISASPYKTAIEGLVAANVIAGFSDNTFRPLAAVTRQQFAKMIVKALGLTVTGDEVCPFTDVAAQVGDDPLYPSKYVAVCASRGITTGVTATAFAPTASITRQQLITMVVRAAGLSEPLSGYDPGFAAGQFTLNDHFLNARKAAYAGLLAGFEGLGASYNFLAESTRGECAQILYSLRQR